jgi:hypothetical protein
VRLWFDPPARTVYLDGSADKARCPVCREHFPHPFFVTEGAKSAHLEFVLHRSRSWARCCRLMAVVLPDGRVEALEIPHGMRDGEQLEWARIAFAPVLTSEVQSP